MCLQIAWQNHPLLNYQRLGSSTLADKSVANMRPCASSNDSVSLSNVSGVCLAMRTASSKDTKYGTSPIIIGGMIDWFEDVGQVKYKSNNI